MQQAPISRSRKHTDENIDPVLASQKTPESSFYNQILALQLLTLNTLNRTALSTVPGSICN